MLEKGKIVEIRGDSAVVEFVRSASCDKCGACMSAGEKNMRVEVQNRLNAKIGDTVSVTLQQSGFLSATALLYIVPLIVFVGALMFASKLGQNDIITMIAGLASAAVVFIILRLCDPIFKRSNKYSPQIIRVDEK